MIDKNFIINNSFILTEGSIIERLRHEYKLNSDNELLNAAWVLDLKKKMETI